jgi:hypothetical protein
MGCEDRRLPVEFVERMRELEQTYLSSDDPIRQSGFLAGPERWREERELILDAVTQDGDLIDVGCANGFLLECLVAWAAERGMRLVPYGVDIGAELIELAKRRIPHHADHFWVGNSWEWRPPRRFRYVYALYDCVPDEFLREYVERLLAHYVSPDGRVMLGAYGSYSRNEPARHLSRDLAEWGFRAAGSSRRGEFPVARVTWIEAAHTRAAAEVDHS